MRQVPGCLWPREIDFSCTERWVPAQGNSLAFKEKLYREDQTGFYSEQVRVGRLRETTRGYC